MLFKKKEPKVINVDGKKIELQPKPGRGLGSIFAKKPKVQKPPTPKPAPKPVQAAAMPVVPAVPQPQGQPAPMPMQKPMPQSQPIQPAQPEHQHAQAHAPAQHRAKQSGIWHRHVEKLAIKNRRIEAMLKQHGMRESLYEFIQRMLIASIIVSIVIASMFLMLFSRIGVALPVAIVLAIVMGIAVNQFAFNSFLKYPLRKAESASKNIERDILFATRDMIISLRSGMPLYNAIVAVSTGYGDASAEFAKITERAQLGLSLEDAIDQTVTESRSPSFRRIMLQASASIKAGADIVAALQSITDQLSQERLISLRRYGQRLNAIAMFYMLFGVILPSMGIAILTILTTFISIFTVNDALLEAAIVGIIFLQVVFLQMIRSSRPVFAL